MSANSQRYSLSSIAISAILALGPPAAAASALTPDVMNKILQLIATGGSETESSPLITNALGLSANGQPWPNRQVIARENRPNYLHGFAVSRGSDEDVMVILRTPNEIRAFRAHRDGTVVRALIDDIQTRKITMLGPAEAQKELDAELVFWTNGVNSLSESPK